MGGTVFLRLRTPQIGYLEHQARWDGISLSQAFASILDRYAPAHISSIPATGGSERRHLTIDPDHAAVLADLSVKWGMERSEVARRLIDIAMTTSDREVSAAVRGR